MYKCNIIITGFSGTGKTNFGYFLSKVIGFFFFDLDIFIRRIFKKNVFDIFYFYGEFFFRKLELIIFKNLLKYNNIIISTGGGSLVNFLNILSYKEFFIFSIGLDINKIINNIYRDYEKRYVTYEGNFEKIYKNRFLFYNSIFHTIKYKNDFKLFFLKLIKIFYLNIKIVKKNTILSIIQNQIFPFIFLYNSKKKIKLILEWLNILDSKIFFIFDNSIDIKLLFLKNINIFTEIYSLKINLKKKDFSSALYIYLKFFNFHLIKKDTCLLFTGGALGDIFSFCFSNYYRGINFIFFPTTILSITDSGFGGKNSIDFFSKNLIGTFYNSILLVIDFLFLKTIFFNYFNYCFSEILKHSLLSNKKILKYLFINKEFNFFFIIYNSVMIKNIFISYDYLEKNKRFLLNLFHTFSHSLEKLSNFNISHSKSIFISLFPILYLSNILSLFSSGSIIIKIKFIFYKFFFKKFFFFFYNIKNFFYFLFYDKKVSEYLKIILPFYYNKFYFIFNLNSCLLNNCVIKIF